MTAVWTCRPPRSRPGGRPPRPRRSRRRSCGCGCSRAQPARGFVGTATRLCAGLQSVAEVALAGEDHRDAVLVGGGDDLVVADRAARLDHRRDAGRGGRVEAVAEREEGVARARPARARGRRPCVGGDAGRVDAVLLAGADADGLAVARRARWRWTTPPRTPATRARGRATASSVGRDLGDDPPCGAVERRRCRRICTSSPPSIDRKSRPARPGGRRRQHAEVLLRGQRRERGVARSRAPRPPR